MDDFALIRAFHKGENYAFDALVMRYKDRIFNLCLRFLGDSHEAEDTSQDVFLKAFKSLNNFRFESSFYTWLYRIAVNSCKNRVKSLWYRFRKNEAWTENSEGSLEGSQFEFMAYSNENPVASLENKEMMNALQKAINTLPSDQKSVVILRDIEGLSYEEITDITGFKLGTLKSRLSRARHSLREKLGDII
ncbi:MAG: sigma-70 family RNA polymerase sigma factor [Deltaproteobacteria bacterium]|nr:sigma-70 family RNA polymerase sigma factor [Deltaproteobacteria bacterium]